MRLLHQNLVSSSKCVQEAVELLRNSGGCAPAAEIVDRILQQPLMDNELAALLISDLIKDDHRLRVRDDHIVELTCEDTETRPLHETDFVVFDLETTGANWPPSRITEIGAYRIERGRIVSEFQTLVNPQTQIPPFVAQLTGITDKMVRAAPVFAEVAHAWLDFAGDAVLIAHNALFDVNFLNHEIASVFPGQRMVNAHLCTVRLARRVVPGLLNYRLHTVAEHFTIPIKNRHRASGDARATAEIFLHLLDRLRDHGVRDLAAARRFRLELPQENP